MCERERERERERETGAAVVAATNLVLLSYTSLFDSSVLVSLYAALPASLAIEDSELPVTRARPADQNVTSNIPREKPEEWTSCLSHKLKHGNRAKDLCISNITFTTTTKVMAHVQ